MPAVGYVTLTLPHGSRVKLEQPFENDQAGAALFDRISRTIEAEWSSCRDATRPDALRRSIPWLTQASYEALSSLIDDDLEGLRQLFADRIKESHGERAPRDSLNMFQVGLMAIFAHNPAALHRRTRERIGKELWHAFRHYVPPAFLLGFLTQVRSPGLARRSVKGVIEPGFESWIVEQRLKGEFNHDARGAYPAAIDEQVSSRSDQHGSWDDDENGIFIG